MPTLKKQRLFTQTGFFLLFLLAPVFDLLRYDLIAGHLYFLGYEWTLGLEAFQQGESSPLDATWKILSRVILPLLAVIGAFIFIAYRWGRIYCGWLCPHYSVLEIINSLMTRSSGKPSLWEDKQLPGKKPDRTYWLLTTGFILLFSFIWAICLLTYLLPPRLVYTNLLQASLSFNQFAFITVASALFTIEFTFARHFFCRYGCAVGFFQSLIWMSNPKSMVIGFDRSRSTACKQCNNACDHACPMRLKPRGEKRHMFACTQCTECIQACEQQQNSPPLIHWVAGDKAHQQSTPPVRIFRPEQD